GTHVHRIEKAVAHPPAPRPVVVHPLPPPKEPPGLPAAPVAAGAVVLSAMSGALGFALGRLRAARSISGPVNESPSDFVRESVGCETSAPAWAQVERRLEETQRQLAAARARLRRLDGSGTSYQIRGESAGS